MVAYDELAAVYDWLVPDALLEPEGVVAVFESVVGRIPEGGRVLDCAAGTGRLAVGLARRGFTVVASDASPEMVEQTRMLADRHGVDVPAIVCTWDDLPAVIAGPFDAVLCVGNSLTHAVGPAGRRSALAAMATMLTDGGLVAVTSRNWERLRAGRPGLDIADRLTYRNGRAGVVVRAWTVPDAWDAPHHVEIAVAVLDAGGVSTIVRELLTFWPFTHQALDDDLRAASLTPVSTTFAPDADRYLVTAVRGAATGHSPIDLTTPARRRPAPSRPALDVPHRP